MISPPVWESRLPVGSSASSSSGSLTSARAMATRCCSPPESSNGLCSVRSPKADARQQFASARYGARGGHAGDAGGQTDIFERGEFGQEMIRLKNKTDAAVAEMRQLTFGERGEILSGKKDFARVGRIQAANQMEQGAFARAGRAAQREKFAARHVEVHAAQHFERAPAHRVSFSRGRGRKGAVHS